MTVRAFVPARGGSKGVPGKNIRPLQGKPLIAYTLEAAQKASRVDSIAVSTDSPEIAKVCEEYGVPVPRLRPEPLAGDTARVQDAILWELEQDPQPSDYLLLLQPTTPFRTEQDVDEAIALAERWNAVSVVGFTLEVTRHPGYMYRVQEENRQRPASVKPLLDIPLGTPRQDFPPMAYRNGAIYLVRTDWFMEHHSFASPDVIPYFMPEERSMNIDTEDDFKLAEWLLEQRSRDTP